MEYYGTSCFMASGDVQAKDSWLLKFSRNMIKQSLLNKRAWQRILTGYQKRKSTLQPNASRLLDSHRQIHIPVSIRLFETVPFQALTTVKNIHMLNSPLFLVREQPYGSIPLHLPANPLPSYPCLQVHEKEPLGVFVQFPFSVSQLWVPIWHSSISLVNKTKMRHHYLFTRETTIILANGELKPTKEIITTRWEKQLFAWDRPLLAKACNSKTVITFIDWCGKKP